jgi:hypothetical protein
MKNPHATLFAGEIYDGRDAQHPLVKLSDGSTAIVRVREMPARHHLELLDLFHIGREADLIQRCGELGTAGEAGALTWGPLTAEFVDSLDDASHALLTTACETLNFNRAIATAQRQIARGQTLGPTMDTIAKTMLAPMRKELGSWMSSLTSQLSAALSAKKL